jgi:hypothetical protein
VNVTIYSEGVTEDGAPEIAYEGKHKCNYQEHAKTVFSEKHKKTLVSGTILIPGDIALECLTISGGFVEILCSTRTIVKGIKSYNPDGTVNFTQLEVE